MGVRFSRAAAIQDIEGRLHAVPSVIKKGDGYLEQIAREGAQEMQHYIASRGTSYSQSQGRSGRVDTETMINDVGYHRNPHASTKVFSWEFGWIDEFLSYFGLQEKGFRHTGGTSVEPMYALRDASTTVRDRMALLGPVILASLSKLIGGR